MGREFSVRGAGTRVLIVLPDDLQHVGISCKAQAAAHQRRAAMDANNISDFHAATACVIRPDIRSVNSGGPDRMYIIECFNNPNVPERQKSCLMRY